MEGGMIMQIGLPVVGIVAAAAVTFYAISFAELREVPLYVQSLTFVCVNL